MNIPLKELIAWLKARVEMAKARTELRKTRQALDAYLPKKETVFIVTAIGKLVQQVVNQTRFDSIRFRKDHPDLFEQYSKPSQQIRLDFYIDEKQTEPLKDANIEEWVTNRKIDLM